MKKTLIYIVFAYVIALALSIYGYIIDTDVTKNSVLYQLFEVFMLSMVLFGLILTIGFLVYSFLILLKKITCKLSTLL